MRICKSCGAELKPGAKFCLECGSAAADTDETSVSEKKEEIKSDTAVPEIKKLPPKPQNIPVTPAPEKKTESEEERKKEELIEETIEKAEEASSAALPEVKQINIIKPKDISVLKPKRAEPAVKKSSVQDHSKPLPTAAELRRLEEEKNKLPPLPAAPKKEAEEIELPKEPKMEYYADESEPRVTAANFVNTRNDDFSNGFYSDVKKNEEKRKNAAVSTSGKSKKKKKSSHAGTVIVILLILAVIVAFVYYFLFIMPEQNGTESPILELLPTETSAETTTVPAEEASSEETLSEEPSSEEASSEETSAELSAVSLEFTHSESVSGSEILRYEFGGENFDLSAMTENSEIIVEFSTSATLSEGMSPLTLTVSDGTAEAAVTESRVEGSTVIYDYSSFNSAFESGGISSVKSMKIRGKGMPVDVSAISVTECR